MMKNLKFLLSIKLNSYSRTKHFISSKVFWFSSKAFTSMTQVNIRGNGTISDIPIYYEFADR